MHHLYSMRRHITARKVKLKCTLNLDIQTQIFFYHTTPSISLFSMTIHISHVLEKEPEGGCVQYVYKTYLSQNCLVVFWVEAFSLLSVEMV